MRRDVSVGTSQQDPEDRYSEPILELLVARLDQALSNPDLLVVLH